MQYFTVALIHVVPFWMIVVKYMQMFNSFYSVLLTTN